MKSYTCLLLTSNGCGHCSAFRGDGLINNGRAYMKYDYINSLFESAANAKLNLLNIHYENMSGQPQFISDISKFTKSSRGIIQQRFFKYENKARIRVIQARGEKNKEMGVKDVLSSNNKVDWSTLVKEKLPDQIKNYTYYFPCFLVIETDEWNKALNNPSYPLAALPNAGKIIKEDNIIKLDRNPTSLNSRNVEIKQLLNTIISGETLIQVEEREDNIPAAKPKIMSKISTKFVIKSYDD
jgi:hypothetical protein